MEKIIHNKRIHHHHIVSGILMPAIICAVYFFIIAPSVGAVSSKDNLGNSNKEEVTEQIDNNQGRQDHAKEEKKLKKIKKCKVNKKTKRKKCNLVTTIDGQVTEEIDLPETVVSDQGIESEAQDPDIEEVTIYEDDSAEESAEINNNEDITTEENSTDRLSPQESAEIVTEDPTPASPAIQENSIQEAAIVNADNEEKSSEPALNETETPATDVAVLPVVPDVSVSEDSQEVYLPEVSDKIEVAMGQNIDQAAQAITEPEDTNTNVDINTDQLPASEINNTAQEEPAQENTNSDSPQSFSVDQGVENNENTENNLVSPSLPVNSLEIIVASGQIASQEKIIPGGSWIMTNDIFPSAVKNENDRAKIDLYETLGAMLAPTINSSEGSANVLINTDSDSLNNKSGAAPLPAGLAQGQDEKNNPQILADQKTEKVQEIISIPQIFQKINSVNSDNLSNPSIWSKIRNFNIEAFAPIGFLSATISLVISTLFLYFVFQFIIK